MSRGRNSRLKHGKSPFSHTVDEDYYQYLGPSAVSYLKDVERARSSEEASQVGIRPGRSTRRQTVTSLHSEILA